MRTWQVYEILNERNGKSYVGITSRALDQRLTKHFQLAFPGRRNPNGTLYALHAAIQKYGIEAFHIRSLESGLTLEDAQRRETYHIKALNAYGGGKNLPHKPRGYNQTLGGETPDFDELAYARSVEEPFAPLASQAGATPPVAKAPEAERKSGCLLSLAFVATAGTLLFEAVKILHS